MARRLASRLRAQDGFGIIEVLVSAILVAIVATGMFAAFDGASNASATNKARSSAANLARSDQERLRGMTAQELAGLSSSPQPQVVDGRTYQVTSTTSWVADRTGVPTCNSADGRADYLKLRSSVTWSGMGSLNPVVVESLRAIPRGAFRPNQGSISIKITDRNGAGVAGATVAISGPQTYSATTNANGCVLLDQVPVGSYTVNVTKTGYVVDKYANPATFTKAITVAKEQTATVEGTMDLAGTGRVSFRTTTAVCTSSCTETSSTGDGFTFANNGLGSQSTINYLLASSTAANANLYTGDAGVALTTSTTKDVFPFTDGYRVWAGACDEADPAAYGAVPNQIVPAGGLTASTPTNTYYVREPRLVISFKKSSGNLNRSRMVIKPVGADCARPIVVENSTTNATTHSTSQPLPYGDYSVCMQETLGSPSGTGSTSGTTNTTAQRTTVTVQNRVANGTTWPTVTLPTSTSSGRCPA